MPPTPPSGPQSMLLPSVIASRFSMSSSSSYGQQQQSMPYVSSSLLIEGGNRSERN